ncbi:hypothetical protein DACRYDRAFT_90806 [Dacryopinax primogenitus]|uniref:Uncharacterized protein n=1 Tax=Dacryopinax primogenitus (strain DJM 731) TaxID=1858805 RepID=M5FTK1_DACPD|nr:uncharacterized protein DACRYDRAFT_90806 [Dacryopinax primogenitus]EJT98714.1 hypothetical protein DACRYDRAFT_90806 [Dacryopinax primogenitus]
MLSGEGRPRLIFKDRDGQQMRFFVDAGGNIDSNTRRTSIRKIQRRGGLIVLSPLEAQYIIVWDDTSDGQLYARTWSGEGKVVLTLEWVNKCVRDEIFLGPTNDYGGCRVSITDGAIKPLANEQPFEDDEEYVHRITTCLPLPQSPFPGRPSPFPLRHLLCLPRSFLSTSLNPQCMAQTSRLADIYRLLCP